MLRTWPSFVFYAMRQALRLSLDTAFVDKCNLVMWSTLGYDDIEFLCLCHDYVRNLHQQEPNLLCKTQVQCHKHEKSYIGSVLWIWNTVIK